MLLQTSYLNQGQYVSERTLSSDFRLNDALCMPSRWLISWLEFNDTFCRATSIQEVNPKPYLPVLYRQMAETGFKPRSFRFPSKYYYHSATEVDYADWRYGNILNVSFFNLCF